MEEIMKTKIIALITFAILFYSVPLVPRAVAKDIHRQRFPGGSAYSVTKEALTGGQGGIGFKDTIDPDYEISEIKIWSGRYIDAIQLIWRKRSDNSHIIVGQKHGGPGGTLSKGSLGLDLKLKPGEYIIAVSGKSGNYVDSMQIQTNKQLYHRNGGQGGANDYVWQAPAGQQIIGFWGRSGSYIDALGALINNR